MAKPQTALAHVDPEEADLEGGMADAHVEVDTTASELIVSQTRELLDVLISALEPGHDAAKVLNQISKVAQQARQTLVAFDPNFEVERNNLTPGQQRRYMKMKRSMNRETAGVRAVQEVMGVMGAVQQTLDAHQLKNMLEAAKIAEQSGMEEQAAQLREQANAIAKSMAGRPIPKMDGEGLARSVVSMVANQADSNEGLDLNDAYSFAEDNEGNMVAPGPYMAWEG